VGVATVCSSLCNPRSDQPKALPGLAAIGGAQALPEVQNYDLDEVMPPDHPVFVFLTEAGLSQYAEPLVMNGFDDMETLLDIEDADMMDIGIPRGHMVKLKKRLREFRCPPSSDHKVDLERTASRSRYLLPTDQMKGAVEQSWTQVQTLGAEVVGEHLYRRFFEACPAAAQSFPQEVRYKYRDWSAEETGIDESDLLKSPGLKKIFAKVVNAVGESVAGLHDLNKLVPMLTQLGIRHATYGATEEYFQILGRALVDTLQGLLGDDFTPEVEFAWTMVYGFMSAIMIGGLRAGGRQMGDNVPPVVDASVGKELHGGREVYRIDRHLQKAIFGDVWEATGTSSGLKFAVKVLERRMVQRFESLVNQDLDHQFCESPLCEVRYDELMRGLEYVVQLEDHFSDRDHHFVISELATGGDLLEALRLRTGGFKERQAQALIREAAKGLTSLHQRGLAMQDVSLENMLLYVLEDGSWRVRVCDPGQAAQFTMDPVTGVEMPVPFTGFAAKDFRPPELYMRKEYLASKVDSWCLGWSTFYLLVAQPLFQSADPAVNDPDWTLFQRGAYSKLFGMKGWRPTLSQHAKDFILKTMHCNPRQRLSVKDSLRHPWLMEARSASSHHAQNPQSADSGIKVMPDLDPFGRPRGSAAKVWTPALPEPPSSQRRDIPTLAYSAGSLQGRAGGGMRASRPDPTGFSAEHAASAPPHDVGLPHFGHDGPLPPVGAIGLGHHGVAPPRSKPPSGRDTPTVTRFNPARSVGNP